MPAHSGNGITTEAARAVVAFGFESLCLSVLTSGYLGPARGCSESYAKRDRPDWDPISGMSGLGRKADRRLSAAITESSRSAPNARKHPLNPAVVRNDYCRRLRVAIKLVKESGVCVTHRQVLATSIEPQIVDRVDDHVAF